MEGDKRFAHVVNDPKFRRIPKGDRKVKIDKRFQSMFEDKKFKVKYTIDKRGRPVNHSTTENLKRYYELDSEEEDDEENEETEESGEDSEEVDEEQSGGDEETSEEDEEVQEEKGKNDKITQAKMKTKKTEAIINKKEAKGKKSTKMGNKEKTIDKVDATDKKISDPIKKKLKNLTVDYARGEGNLLSDESSSDDEETDDEVELLDEAEGIDHKWGELDADAESTEEATRRLAACNMDWDRIRASDLLVLFTSFLPPGGSISSVVIYPSEFGKKRLAEEEVKGPAELVEAKHDDAGAGGTEEGAKYHMEKLRQYQLNRLKYYYAVVTCDAATSANKIYAECDGMEYESSATKIDLRFIPDDMTFDDEPKEVCDKLPEVTKYQPRFFTTTALQQAKVDLTWDETNPDRVEIAAKLASGKIDDVADADLQNYLASSSEESENEEEAKSAHSDEENGAEKPKGKKGMIDKYKMLLQEIENNEKSKEKEDVAMEISWGVDLQKKTEQIMKDKKAFGEERTPFEQFLDKRSEKRKEKRKAKKNQNENEENDSDDSAPSDVDMNDPYFAEEFNKPEFKQKTNKKKAKAKEIDSDYDSESETEAADRKARLELLLNDEDDGKKHFSLKKIQDNENESKTKKKRKNKKKPGTETVEQTDDFQVNVNDDRFSALFTSHHYNIDPTDPHFKKTKNMEKLISEKIKRRVAMDDGDNVDETQKSKKAKVDLGAKKKKKTNAELNVLVKSVKRKAEAFKNKKK